MYINFTLTTSLHISYLLLGIQKQWSPIIIGYPIKKQERFTLNKKEKHVGAKQWF